MLFQKILSDRTVIKSGAWLIFEKVLLLGKGLFLAYLYANWLSKEVYGQYQFIIAFLGAASVIIVPGMGIAIVQALARSKDGTFARATQMMFRMAYWGSGLLTLFAGYYAYLEKFEFTKIFILLAMIFPGYIIMNLWRYYYTGKVQFDRLVKVSAILETVSLLFVLGALFYFPELLGLVILGIVLPIPFSLLLVWSLYKKSRNLPLDEDNIRFGRKISYAVGLATLATYGDKLLLGHFLGFTELAVYSIAMIIPEQARGAITSFMTPLLPQYSKDGDEGKLKEHFIFFTLLSALVIATLYFLLPVFFKMVFSQYTDGVLYARLLLMVLLFIPFTLLEVFFRSQKNEQAVLRATLIGSIAGIFLALMLVPFFGIIGAIGAKIGSLLLQAGSFTASYFYPRKNITIRESKNG